MLNEEYVLQPPRKQMFYRNIATLISFYALGKRNWWGFEPLTKFLTFHRRLTVLCSPIIIASLIIYLALHYRTLPFDNLTIILSIFPVACVVNVSVASAQRKGYENIMKKFMDHIHLHNYKDMNDFAKQKAIQAEYYTRRAGSFLLVCMVTDWILWVVIPIQHYFKNTEEIKNGTIMLQTLLHFWMPFDYGYNVRNWLVVHIINGYLGFAACIMVASFNTINYMFVFHLIGHIEILKHRFIVEFSGKLNEKETSKKLISLLKDHSFILGIFKEIQDVFGYNVTANYCHNLLSDSLLLYLVMIGENQSWILYGLLLLVFLGGLVLMSLILEEIRRQSDNLADIVYSIPWENMSVPNRRTFLLILFRAQPTLEFISAGGLRAGVRPMISIVKSTFSYYVMLKTSIKIVD